jgi:hypothetical protein
MSLATPAWANSIFDILGSSEGDQPLEVTLDYQIDSLHRKNVDQHKAVFSFIDQTGKVQGWDLKISVRGKFRLRTCEFSPLKLDFKKKDLKAAGLSEFDKYKLVTPCFAGASAEAALLREYLAYRVYNVVSPLSYRVKLLRLTHTDVNGNHPDRTVLAFLLESTGQLAARTNTEVLNENVGLPAGAYDPVEEATHAMFQYLIGNADWSNKLALNVKKLRLESGAIVPVGYDFDFSGWANTNYALPKREVGQEFIGDRVYLGYTQADKIIAATTLHFEGHEQELLQLLEHPLLRRSDRRKLRLYIRSFYTTLEFLLRGDEAILYEKLRASARGLIPLGTKVEDFLPTREK